MVGDDPAVDPDDPVVVDGAVVVDAPINIKRAVEIFSSQSSGNGGVIACGRKSIIPVSCVSPISAIGTGEGGLRESSR